MKRRPGLALFQLLAVLAVLLILLGLLLPAVQKVREAAARMQSANNMKQLALAMHGHYNARTQMPAGADANQHSALVYLLPYIEQDNIFRQIDLTKRPDDKANAAMRAVVLKIFQNPSDEIGQIDPKSGPTSYFFNAGSKPELKDNNGLFFPTSKIKFTDITDGTSNTVAIVESLKGDGRTRATTVVRQHVKRAAKDLPGIKDDAGFKDWNDAVEAAKAEPDGKTAAGGNIVGNRGSAWMDGAYLQTLLTAGRTANSSKPDVDCGGEGGMAGPRTNRNVFQVALCDGSVRAVSTSIKLATWQAACTRAGGEVLGADW